ncbi:hypothetical protein RRG08_038832 [Elysia crispata]|uniref:Uncharacterized protein n=1 Tax=Elysia crispata TaxID=231223 RepID=A0AAE0YSX4_9GAST|nr:hypothetical protein RRG08_038832 [Elysia crispata]
MVQSAEQKKITRGRQWSQQTHTQTKGIKTVGRIGFGAGKTSTEDESNLQHILYYSVTGPEPHCMHCLAVRHASDRPDMTFHKGFLWQVQGSPSGVSSEPHTVTSTCLTRQLSRAPASKAVLIEDRKTAWFPNGTQFIKTKYCIIRLPQTARSSSRLNIVSFVFPKRHAVHQD